MFKLKSGEMLDTMIRGKSAVKNPIVKNAMPSVDEMNALQPQPEAAPAQLAINAAIDSPKKITVLSLARMSVSAAAKPANTT